MFDLYVFISASIFPFFESIMKNIFHQQKCHRCHYWCHLNCFLHCEIVSVCGSGSGIIYDVCCKQWRWQPSYSLMLPSLLMFVAALLVEALRDISVSVLASSAEYVHRIGLFSGQLQFIWIEKKWLYVGARVFVNFFPTLTMSTRMDTVPGVTKMTAMSGGGGEIFL